jgi:hypothetical protein
MGWSKAGLAKMTQIRVFQQNGGRVLPADIRTGTTEGGARRTVPLPINKYDALARSQQEEALAGAKDWGMFARRGARQVAPSGTKVALNALGRIRGIS